MAFLAKFSAVFLVSWFLVWLLLYRSLTTQTQKQVEEHFHDRQYGVKNIKLELDQELPLLEDTIVEGSKINSDFELLPSVPISESSIYAAENEGIGCLCGIVAYFNPAGYKTRYENFRKFRSRTKDQGLWLLAIELAFGSEPHELGPEDAEKVILLRTSSSNVMWQKERLLNIALDNIPSNCKNIAWLDTELLFVNENWITSTCLALEKYFVVQPFQGVVRLEKDDEWVNGYYNLTIQEKKEKYKATRGISYSVFLKGTSKSVLNSQSVHGFTGFAWAARYGVLQQTRFYDANIVGGGDALMAHAFFGHVKVDREQKESGGVRYTPYYYKTHFKGLRELEGVFTKWALKAYSIVQGRVGYVDGIVLHLWHGSKRNRQYDSRYKILSAAKYSPKEDIRLSVGNQSCTEGNVWEWATFSTSKLKLHKKVREMFVDRLEDI